MCVFVCRAEAVTLNDCLQLSYLPSKRNHMLLLYSREILILDLELSQTVGVVAIERSGVPFIQVCVNRKCESLHSRFRKGAFFSLKWFKLKKNKKKSHIFAYLIALCHLNNC